MSNQYPAPPPAYGPAGSTQKPNYNSFEETREPLLAGSSRGGGGGFYDQPNPGDLPDDFKVRRFPFFFLFVVGGFVTYLSIPVWSLRC